MKLLKVNISLAQTLPRFALDDDAYHNTNNQAFIPLSGDNLVDNACVKKKKNLHLDLYHAVYCSEARSGADISIASCMIDSSGA